MICGGRLRRSKRSAGSAARGRVSGPGGAAAGGSTATGRAAPGGDTAAHGGAHVADAAAVSTALIDSAGADSAIVHSLLQAAEQDKQVVALYSQVLGREPDEGERTAAAKFLREKQDGKEMTLADLAHVLLNSNEFVYVD